MHKKYMFILLLNARQHKICHFHVLIEGDDDDLKDMFIIVKKTSFFQMHEERKLSFCNLLVLETVFCVELTFYII